MSRYNKGLIFTNENCIACNKCVSQCSTFGANVSVLENNKLKIQVDSTLCNNCGKCIDLCIHQARDYRDDFSLFLEDLQHGEKISVILSPIFNLYFGDKLNNFVGYLKSLGIDKVYDGTFGEEISIWAHTKYVKEHLSDCTRGFICQTCPSLVNTVELYYPKLLPRLIPVQSPLICTAIYARKYLSDLNKIAFLGTCVSAKDEINCTHCFGLVNYNITYKNFYEHFNNSDIEEFSSEFDLKSFGFGQVSNFTGGFSQLISYFFPPEYETKSLIGFNPANFELLQMQSENQYEQNMPLVTEVKACNSCAHFNSYSSFQNVNKPLIYSRYSKILSQLKQIYKQENYEDNYLKLCSVFELLNPEDFNRKFQNRYKQSYNLPQEVLNDVFLSMKKNTIEKQNINCGICGYKTCSQMAKSIAFGFNRKENCIHYMNDEMLERTQKDVASDLLNLPTFASLASEYILKNEDKDFVLIAGDINKYKIINELFGISVGDKVLPLMAKKIQQIFPSTKLMTRVGGGIFALLLENKEENLQKLYDIKSFDFSEIGITYPVTMSFGLAQIEQNQNGVLFYLERALMVKDRIPGSVINTYSWFDEKYKSQLMEETQITSLMQDAIKNKEIQICFQPQFNAKTEKIVSAEVLCYWKKQDGTIIPNAKFIPIAEKNKLIKEIDKQIWKDAFILQSNLIKQNKQIVPLALNISRITLLSEDCISYIQELQSTYNLPKELIHFEITESAYMNNQNILIERVNSIKKLGFKIAIDDFGTGYSSLNILKDLPADIIKFDMLFFKDNVENNKNANIVDLILRLAKNLNLITIAEGVSSEENASFLRKRGCDIIQGFLYSKTITKEEFLNLLENSQLSKPILFPSPSLYEKTPIGTCLVSFNYDITDLKNSLKIKLEFANEQFVDYFNIPYSQILQWTQKDMLGRLSSQDLEELFKKLIGVLISQNIKPFEYFCHIKDKDGITKEIKVLINISKTENKDYYAILNFLRTE